MRVKGAFKTVRNYVVAFALAALITSLVIAIYLTRLNLPWTAFLTGILVAAVLSLVSRASRAEWIMHSVLRPLYTSPALRLQWHAIRVTDGHLANANP